MDVDVVLKLNIDALTDWRGQSCDDQKRRVEQKMIELLYLHAECKRHERFLTLEGSQPLAGG
jgi:hypothetical protein